ncbi:TRAP transporter substrate-binding protein DctP [Thermodesulfobacteriota bacterium]
MTKHHYFRIFSFSILLIALIFTVSGQPEALAQKPVELSLVTFGPTMITEVVILKKLFIERVNEKGKGELKINLKGGPEVMATFNQPVSVKKGIIDMCLTSYTFFPSVVPGSDLFRASDFNPKEIRERGGDEFFRKECEKVGIYYLGNPIPDPEKFFWILSKKKMETKDEFKGNRIAGSPPFYAFYKRLGMVPQQIHGLKDYFPLMERGVVQAHVSALNIFIKLGTYEVAKYIIDHPFYNSTQAILINLNKWKSLPKSSQDLLHEVMLEQETTVPPAWGKIMTEMRKKLLAGGIEFYKLSPDMEKWYYSAAIDGAWEEALTKYPADLVAGYRKYLRR